MEQEAKEKTIHEGETGFAEEIIQEEERNSGKKTFNEEEEELLSLGLGIKVLVDIRYWRCKKLLLPPDKFSKKFKKKLDRTFSKNLKQSVRLKRNEEKIKESHIWKSYFRMKIPVYVMIGFITIISLGVGIETEAIPFPKFTYTVQKEEKAYRYIADMQDSLKETITELYEPIELPRKLKLLKTIKTNQLYKIDYIDENNEPVVFWQSARVYVTKLDIVNDYKEIIFNESKYYIHTKNPSKTIIWYENGYQFFFEGNYYTNQQLIQIAQNIKVKSK